MGPECSLPYPHERATGPYEPDESSPHTRTLFTLQGLVSGLFPLIFLTIIL
jgi:hypothetical protein